MARKILLVFLCAVTLLIGAYIVYQFVDSGFELEGINSRAFVALFTGLIAISRIIMRGNSSGISKGVLRNQYAELIGDAFSDSRKDYNLLIDALWFYNVDKFDKAISLLKKLITKCKTDRDFAVTYFFLGVCYDDTLNFNAAIDAYEESIRSDPYYDGAYTNLAVIHKSNGNFDEAVRCCNRALDLNRANGIAYEVLAGTYLNMHNPEKAIEYGLEALKITENMHQAMNTLAIAYSMENNREKAEEYYQKSVLNGCVNPEMLRQLMSSVNT